MGDYKVLHTFSPSFNLWGTTLETSPDRVHHERVIYLAMVEYQPVRGNIPEREVLAFGTDGEVVSISDGRGLDGPCGMQGETWLVCAGHSRSDWESGKS